jgi:hypothetical protein
MPPDGPAAETSQPGAVHDAPVIHGVDWLQDEGEKLARKNGELEAALRRVRAANRDSDAERDRLAARIASLESQACTLHLTCSLLTSPLPG